ncbi:MAG: DNA polymerase III subunit gamma/tau, partial [Candidatus Omnitrophica bacterium]|nr:DNA polymerase III subunit gamma/tau [Candidatus Omnitrophota bacterium]
AKKHVHHAYIFSGPRGVGKTSLARIFATALNCFQGPTVAPCGKCISCIEIAKGTPLDVIEIDAASNRGIDEMRVLRENVSLSPTYSRYKIYIIDEVHMLSQDAFNALLKTLEEPPAHVKFIFATTHIHKVLPTIQSRCQKFQFNLVSLELIVRKLKDIARQEKLKIEDTLLYAVARAAEGSIRDAESLLDQLVPVMLQEGSNQDILSFLGIVDETSLNSALEYLFTKDLDAAIALIDTMVNNGKDLGTFSVALMEHARNLLLAKVSPKNFERIAGIVPQTKEYLLKLAAGAQTGAILNIIDSLIKVRELSQRLNTARIPLELAFIKFICPPQRQEIAPDAAAIPKAPVPPPAVPELKKSFSRITQAHKEIDAHFEEEEDAQKNSTPRAPKDVGVACANDDVLIVEVKEKWKEILSDMQKKRAAIASHLMLAEPHTSAGAVVTIAFAKRDYFHKEIVEGNKNVRFIEEILSGVLGRPVGVKFIISDDVQSPTQVMPHDQFSAQAENRNGQQSSGAHADNDFMNDLLDTFGGTFHTES